MEYEQKWLNEVMSQNIDASHGEDYTRIILNFFFIKENVFNNEINIEKLYKFVYRFYIDNTRFAIKNPYPIIKNITHYKPSDLKEYCKEQLMIWKKGKSSLLYYDDEIIKINGKIELNDEYIKKYKFILNIMLKKYLKEEFWYDDEDKLININEINKNYLSVMKKSRLRNRVFEELNYCPLCEEIREEKLNLVHIKRYIECSDIELMDVNNTILLCDDHCKMYMDNSFSFKNNGYIKVLKSDEQLDERMHLSIELLNPKRKKYIEEIKYIN